jgi:WD40 repeat protein
MSDAPLLSERYKAFISYSTGPDAKIARGLRRALLRIGVSWFRRRRFEIFLDAESLHATPALTDTLEQAISRSEHFLFLASPAAAASRVARLEVEHRLRDRNRSASGLQLALTAGEIRWDVESGDFDWERTTALPPCLSGIYAGEPKYVDLQWLRTSVWRRLPTILWLWSPRFRGAVAALAAAYYDSTVEAVLNDERRQRILTSAVAILLLALSIGGGVAAHLARRAERQQALISDSIRLAEESNGALDSLPDLGMLLAAEAFQRADTYAARKALLGALLRYPTLEAILPPAEEPVTALAFSGDGRRLVSASGDVVTIWDVRTRRRVATLKHPASVRAVALSPDGSLAVTGSMRAGIALWDVATSRVSDWQLDGLLEPDGSLRDGAPRQVGALAGRADGLVAAATERGVFVWQMQTRRLLGTVREPGATAVALGQRHDDLLAVGYDRGLVSVRNFRTGASLGAGDTHQESVRALSFIAGDRRLVVGGSQVAPGSTTATEGLPPTLFESSVVLDWRTGKVLSASFAPLRDVLAIASSSDERVLVLGTIEGFESVALSDEGEATFVDPAMPSSSFNVARSSVAVSPDGRRIALGGEDGRIAWLDMRGTHVASAAAGVTDRILAVAFGRGRTDGTVSVVAGERLVLLQLPGGTPCSSLALPAQRRGIDGVRALRYTPDGTSLTLLTDAGVLMQFDLGGRGCSATLRSSKELVAGDFPSLSEGSLSPDAAFLVYRDAYDSTTRVRDLPRGIDVATLTTSGFPGDLGFLSRHAAIVGRLDSEVVVWDAATGERLRGPWKTTAVGTLLGVDPLSQRAAFATSSGDRIALWDLRSGTSVARLPEAHEGVQSVLFSDDGDVMISAGAGADPTVERFSIYLWDLTARRQVALLHHPVPYGHDWREQGQPFGMRHLQMDLTGDGRRLAIADHAGLHFLDLDPRSWLRKACSVVDRPFLDSEWAQYVGGPHIVPTCGEVVASSR